MCSVYVVLYDVLIILGEDGTDSFRRPLSQGKVRQGWFLLRQAAQMGQDMGLLMLPRVVQPYRDDMGLFVLPGSAGSSGDDEVKDEDADEGLMSPEMDRIRTITAWGIFNLNL